MSSDQSALQRYESPTGNFILDFNHNRRCVILDIKVFMYWKDPSRANRDTGTLVYTGGYSYYLYTYYADSFDNLHVFLSQCLEQFISV